MHSDLAMRVCVCVFFFCFFFCSKSGAAMAAPDAPLPPALVCQLKSRRGGKQNVHHIDDSPSDTGEIDSVPLFLIRESSPHVPPYRVNVHVNDVNTPINMEFDTASGVSTL